MIITCPSKTFLLGEYLALKGGPTLLAATEPRFQLHLKKGTGTSPFHADSPAGRIWNSNQELTREWNAEFQNPAALGGLGASSAEFLLLHTALQIQQTLAWESQLESDLSQILRDYQDVNADRAVKPSGADLVSQLRGRVTFFERSRGKIETRGWGFTDLSFLLFSTGVKVPTHDHLASLGQWNESDLLAAAELGTAAWLQADARGFIESVRKTRFELQQLGFEAPTTTRLLGELVEAPEILAAKGCGALCADVILVLCEPAQKEELQINLSRRLRFLASEADLSEGLKFIPQSVETTEVTP